MVPPLPRGVAATLPTTDRAMEQTIRAARMVPMTDTQTGVVAVLSVAASYL